MQHPRQQIHEITIFEEAVVVPQTIEFGQLAEKLDLFCQYFRVHPALYAENPATYL